jgi:hypothetical protein
MRCLLLSSILLSLIGCSLAKNNIATIKPECPVITRRLVNTVTYDTRIDIFGKHFSGLTVFKATSDTTERVVFITQLGLKFFDYEFTPSGFSVKYSVPWPGEKLIIKMLQKNLDYLSCSHQLQTLSTNDKNGATTYRCKAKHGRFDYYTVNTGCSEIKKIQHGNAIYTKRSIDFGEMKNGNFDTIRMRDHSAFLKILMKQIDK